jgi:predicted nuclease with TOPRIM domain
VKNKNQELINENTILKEKLNKLNMDINNIQDLKDKIKSLEKELNKKNEEIQQLLSQNNNNQGKYKITSINPGEEIMCINFVSMSNQDINNYGLVCKNTDLFIRAEERLYEDFPQFKKYETYFEANGKRIKRFQTLSENNIKDKNVINLFIIEE